MVREYLKTILNEQNASYLEDGNSFIVECGGNDLDFIRMNNFINENIESWTYHLELCLNIKIDTAYERIIIEYWEA